jgi:ribosomal protein S18 acetylase RimI-like enzyme
MLPCSIDEVLSLTDRDPFVRGVRGAERGPAWRTSDGGAIAFTGYDAEDNVRSLAALGPPEATAALVLAVHGEVPPGIRVMVPRGTPLPFAGPVDWHFRAAREEPPEQPAEDAVAWCADEEAITELLRLVSPDASVWPGDPKARRWAGIRDGRLLACLADTTTVAGVGHISAISVHAEARGRAYGPSITAWATRRLLAEGCDAVTLGVYAGNTVALRMYDRLGFTLDRAMTSGRLKQNGQ